MQLAPGALIGGKYRIERPLAKGGMGSVWVARHEQLGSTVAIKFLDASFAASAAHRARFEREARAAASLKSPHVVHVGDYGFEGDAPYLVMELLEGEDLGQRLHRVGRMSLRDTAKVLVQVGKALRKAHEAGFAHRDLKPANLFIARIDDDEVVKILDFGIAKDQHAAAGEATRTGEVIGSPHYMSPEQVRAEKDLDHRTDLWSLGIILFRMLTGSLPFPGDQLGPVLAKILTDPLPVATQAAPDLPPAMDAFFARALARDKNQRFQSVQEMVDGYMAAAGGKDAFPSISMSLGTGQLQGPQGTQVWLPGQPQAPGPITGSHGGAISGSGPQTGSVASMTGPHTGQHTGPMAGSTSGLVSTGAPVPKSGGPGVAVAIVAVLVALAGIGVGAFFLFFRSSSPAAGASSDPTVTASATSTVAVQPVVSATATAAPTASEAPTTTAATEPTAAPTTSASAKPTVTAKPKASGAPTSTKTKEKWF